MRNRLAALGLALLLCTACDNREEEIMPEESAPASQPATAPANPLDGPMQSIPLGVIPFRGDVPPSWAVQGGLGNKIVLHGVLPTGEIDVLLSTLPPLSAETFKNLLAGYERATTQTSKESVRVLKRNDMTIVETVNRPREGLVTYKVEYFVAGPSLEQLVYALSIGDLTEEMFEKDGETIRKVLLNFNYVPSATELPR